MEASPNLSICESFCTRLKTFLWSRILYLHIEQHCMNCSSHIWQRRQLQRGKGHSSRWAIAGILGSSLWSLSCIWADTLVYTLCKALLHPLLLLLKLQTQPKCTFAETGNKTSLKTLSRGGRCTETKEEGAVLHSRALQPSATKPQIAPT